uniref:Glutathione peroxidase n=1 Tax=Ditylenchus dipsaci TaxID=166011 RepID=A0A915E3F6_9BILA
MPHHSILLIGCDCNREDAVVEIVKSLQQLQLAAEEVFNRSADRLNRCQNRVLGFVSRLDVLDRKFVGHIQRFFAMANTTDPHSIYQFKVIDADGKEVSMEKYKGKAVLIVNVASKCGFTDSNYSQLKEILDSHKEKGLEVAAFPCNQFGGQEPSCEIDIRNFVKEKFKFEPDLYAKVDVNGKNEIDKEGHVINRYAPTTEPNKIIPDIEKILSK